MYVQRCVKGIGGGLDWAGAQAILTAGDGIQCNWWRNMHRITPAQVRRQLTPRNLDRHLHDYANFGADTPFISLASGSVERNAFLARNIIHRARDVALAFATDNGAHAGALFYCWVIVGHRAATEVEAVSETVRDLLVYRNWSPFQLEGEITAKIHIPANQIEQVEWWDPTHGLTTPVDTLANPAFTRPGILSNIVDLF